MSNKILSKGSKSQQLRSLRTQKSAVSDTYLPKSEVYFEGLRQQMDRQQLNTISKFEPQLRVLGKTNVPKPSKGITKRNEDDVRSKSLPSLKLRSMVPPRSVMKHTNHRRPASTEGERFGHNSLKFKLNQVVVTKHNTKWHYRKRIRYRFRRAIWAVISLIRIKYNLPYMGKRNKRNTRMNTFINQSRSKTTDGHTPSMSINTASRVVSRIKRLEPIRHMQTDVSQRQPRKSYAFQGQPVNTLQAFIEQTNTEGREREKSLESLTQFNKRFLKKSKDEVTRFRQRSVRQGEANDSLNFTFKEENRVEVKHSKSREAFKVQRFCANTPFLEHVRGSGRAMMFRRSNNLNSASVYIVKL